MDRDFDETVVVCIEPMKGFHSPQLVDAAPVKGGDDHYSLCNLRPFLLYLLTVMMISLFECCVVLGPFRLIMSALLLAIKRIMSKQAAVTWRTACSWEFAKKAILSHRLWFEFTQRSLSNFTSLKHTKTRLVDSGQ